MRTRSRHLIWNSMAWLCALVLGPLLVGCGSSNETTIDCAIAIVGGGPGGLHTAFRLAASEGPNVCLIEKEATLGGRIHDVAFDEKDPSSPRVGVGARRVMETQEVLFSLASELGITLEKPPQKADLIGARGKYAFAKDDLRTQYQGLLTQQDPGVDYETWLYDVLRKGPGRANIGSAVDLRSYVRMHAGLSGYDFLRDMSRFRADFEYPLDARGYMDYLDEEWDVCCQASYPVGGMSAFIQGMEKKALERGVRIFPSQAVTHIERSGKGFRYRVRSQAQSDGQKDLIVNANRLVVAVSPYWLKQIEGDIAADIKNRSEFQQITGVRVVTVTQWWPEAWWQAIKDPGKTQDNNIWRAWTTDLCLNFMEIPQEAYAAAGKVTRTVYDDDIRCVQFWEELAKQGMPKLEAELQAQLNKLFNNNGATVPATVNIPKPLKTYFHVWPDAWHWLGASATLSNADLANWAVQPLSGEDVGLVGEAYYVNRSGWSDGAFKSSLRLLNEKYGQKLPGVSARAQGLAGSAATSPWAPARRLRSQAGH